MRYTQKCADENGYNIHYEEKGMEHHRPYCRYDEYEQPAVKRLGELEDKLESGRLVELPCKIGDTVYWNNGVCITPYRVDGFADYNDGMGLRLLIDDMQPSLQLVGKDLFFDKEQAEQRLAQELEAKRQ